MTNSEMLQKLLNQSGWIVTDEKDETGATIVRSVESDETND